MTKAMPFLQKVILLSYDPRPLLPAAFLLFTVFSLSATENSCAGKNKQRCKPQRYITAVPIILRKDRAGK